MTPTSATGAERDAGFTLVELMVAIVIVGLAGAAVVLTMPDPRPPLSAEAERFAARLVRAREEAILTNRLVDVAVTPEGYGFRRLERGEWSPLDGRTFADEAWSEGVSARLVTESGRAGVRFDPTGGAEAGRLTLRREARSIHVDVDAAGEVRVDG
jgi:general secretion pathway protein H